MTPTEFQLNLDQPQVCGNDDEETVPVTSQLCQWKRPKKRKESNLRMSDAKSERHDYSRSTKRQIVLVEDFDPRPQEFRGTAGENLPSLIEAIHGQGLCISLLLDPNCRCFTDSIPTPSTAPTLPSLSALKDTAASFKESLQTSEEKIREIERETRSQRDSPLWYSVRRCRITASHFGAVLRRRDDTPPDSLVLTILQQKQFSSVATSWGIKNEANAVKLYVVYQQAHGHENLMVTPSGFQICKSQSYLGASPDGAVYDPTDVHQPFGFLEVKCPYSNRNDTPKQACASSGFCCILEQDEVTLRRTHPYPADGCG